MKTYHTCLPVIASLSSLPASSGVVLEPQCLQSSVRGECTERQRVSLQEMESLTLGDQ